MNVLLVSLPGIYPSFPAVGLEMVAQGLREKGYFPTIINGHLEIVEFLDGRLLLSVCRQNLWDLFYASLVYPGAKVGLQSRSVLRMLTAQSQGYQFTEDELVTIASGIAGFNRHLTRRIPRVCRAIPDRIQRSEQSAAVGQIFRPGGQGDVGASCLHTGGGSKRA